MTAPNLEAEMARLGFPTEAYQNIARQAKLSVLQSISDDAELSDAGKLQRLVEALVILDIPTGQILEMLFTVSDPVLHAALEIVASGRDLAPLA